MIERMRTLFLALLPDLNLRYRPETRVTMTHSDIGRGITEKELELFLSLEHTPVRVVGVGTYPNASELGLGPHAGFEEFIAALGLYLSAEVQDQPRKKCAMFLVLELPENVLEIRRRLVDAHNNALTYGQRRLMSPPHPHVTVMFAGRDVHGVDKSPTSINPVFLDPVFARAVFPGWQDGQDVCVELGGLLGHYMIGADEAGRNAFEWRKIKE